MWEPGLYIDTTGCKVVKLRKTQIDSTRLTVSYDQNIEPVRFAVDDLRERLAGIGRWVTIEDRPDQADVVISSRANLSAPLLKSCSFREREFAAEAFAIYSTPDGRLVVTADDDSGLLYGTLSLAEEIRNVGLIPEAKSTYQEARFPFRAMKINLPWSSYRRGEAMTTHTGVMRTKKFWTDLIDMLARNRFNALTIWCLHPFPFMFRPKNFPEACPFSDDELSEWRQLWMHIFRNCRNRCVASYLVNWNIFVSPSLEPLWGIDYGGSEYHIGPGDLSERAKQYNRECITQLINEYEDLTGIGTSVGERMDNLSAHEREQWIADVVISGIEHANRPVDFIHRAPFTADPTEVRKVIEESNLERPVWLEYKFNWSHGHSSTQLCMSHDVGQPGRKTGVDDRYWTPAPTRHKMVWTVRNEDFFILRWGTPDFIRSHIDRNGHSYVGGYIVGSEGYIPAKDYSLKDGVPHSWTYAFQKQWLFYMVWGRLLYDPETPNSVFEAEFASRYGKQVGPLLFGAYAAASKMPLRFASFHAETWDYALYSEGFMSVFPTLSRRDSFARSSLVGIDNFISHPTLDDELLSIQDYVASGEPRPEAADGRTTPLELADWSEADGEAALRYLREIAKLREIVVNDDLDNEIADAEIWAHLSLYFAHKLRGGTALHAFRIGGDRQRRLVAVDYLKKAAAEWKEVVRIGKSNYRTVPYIDRSEYGLKVDFHWSHHQADVARDVQLAEHAVFD